MKINLKKFGRIADDTLESISNVNGSTFVSLSASRSPLQVEYKKFFDGQLAEHGFKTNPFEGTLEQTTKFFDDISKRWPKRREEFEEKNGAQD